MIHCFKCGSDLPDNMLYCLHCGSLLNDEAETVVKERIEPPPVAPSVKRELGWSVSAVTKAALAIIGLGVMGIMLYMIGRQSVDSRIPPDAFNQTPNFAQGVSALPPTPDTSPIINAEPDAPSSVKPDLSKTKPSKTPINVDEVRGEIVNREMRAINAVRRAPYPNRPATNAPPANYIYSIKPATNRPVTRTKGRSAQCRDGSAEWRASDFHLMCIKNGGVLYWGN